ncbi:MAG TPA: ABC transporter permease [Micromonosporaceae bacterium]|nr:ABC transporter permease [Micromonosporaceae bacterium]
MLTAIALPRLLAGIEQRATRAAAVAGRNAVAARHAAYWWVIISGFFEPVLYLLSIGVGVGTLVGDFPLPDGGTVSYAAFVAPAMLASSAMNGSFNETTLNFYGKMKFMRLYDGVLATPVTPFEIAVGELMWALARGAVYSAAFLAIMAAMGLTAPLWALAAFPATVLIGIGFGALGMLISTFIRSWKDFDYIILMQFALFLFSGTFAPVESFPPPLRIVVELTPLYHGVELVRNFTTGSPDPAVLGHAAYLVAIAALGLWAASRRMTALLCK